MTLRPCEPESTARSQLIMSAAPQDQHARLGSRPASLLSSPQAIEQLRQMQSSWGEFGSFEEKQKTFANEAVAQQYRSALTNFQSAMTEFGITFLPLASRALTKLNTHLGELITWMTKNPGKVKE